MKAEHEYIDWGFHCPACGYPYLNNPHHREPGGASYEICPSCGIQFGYDDDDLGISYLVWRERWIANGMLWFSKSITPPNNWNAEVQLNQMDLN